MDDRIELRRAAARDTTSIVTLVTSVFEAASIDARIQKQFGGPSWKRVKGDAVRQELSRNPAGCFVAVRGKRVVGVVTTTVNPVASRGIIANVAVAASCQGQGLGRKLIERALQHFRDIGLRQAKIETLTTNEAGQRLYPSLGFREVARQIHFAMPLGRGARCAGG